MILLLFWSMFITSLRAELQSCSVEKNHEEYGAKICFLKNFRPLEPPLKAQNWTTVDLQTKLRLLDVHNINPDEKSISLYIELFSYWYDYGISKTSEPE